MVIAPDFVFLCIPRCASTLMANVYLPQFGGVSVQPHHGRVVPPEHSGKFTFAIVRNPYERMLSIYHHWMDNGFQGIEALVSATEFIRYYQHRHDGLGQVEFCDSARVDQFLRYESLASEVLDLPFNLRRIPLPTERVNASREPVSLDEMTPEFIERVNVIERRTFEAFPEYPMFQLTAAAAGPMTGVGDGI